MKRKPKEKKETTTIVLELSVYTQLKEMKIIPAEPFSDVIKRVLSEYQTLMGKTTGGELVRQNGVNPSIQISENIPKSV